MAKITEHGGVSDMTADVEEARRNLAANGIPDPTQDQVDDELQGIVDRRKGSAHLEQGDAGTVTPAHQAAKHAADPDTSDAGDGGDAVVPGTQYDPGDHTVAEVQEYLDGLPEDDPERDRVLAAERAGKARTTLIG